MAYNLALSYIYTNAHTQIPLYIVTDNSAHYKKLTGKYSFIKIIDIDMSKYEIGFSIKLHIDEFIQTQNNIFVDCDCLVYKDCSSVFGYFDAQNFSAIGEMWDSGEFFCDIPKIIREFKLQSVPVFVGALYYISKGDVSSKIFKRARELKTQYDE